MKIRTDFVTNSSSYSSAEIVIDNPVLLEILQKYKDMGAFEYMSLEIGNYGTSSNPGCYTKTPAFYISESNMGVPPESLGNLLDRIIEYFKEFGEIDDEMLEQILTELDKRREDIDSAYKEVVWEYRSTSNEGDEGLIDETCDFYYDPERGERHQNAQY